jgi:hypothetical protein
VINIPIYQYIALEKDDIPLIDSKKTPRTTLPLFNPSLINVGFNTNIENGNVLMHAYYTSPVIDDAVNPVAAVYFVYYESCFVTTCWTGTDFCNYPIVIQSSLVILKNLQEALKYARQNIDTNVRINPSNGCFYVTLDKDLLNVKVISKISQRIPIITAGDPFMLGLNTQLGTREFKLCTTTYTENALFDYYVATTSYYDFYINYGDGTLTEHYVGTFGVSNPIIHVYSLSAPQFVNVTIAGLLPGWSCTAMHEQGGGINPMTIDIISWGDVSLKQADFYYESNMLAISAGSPPPTMEGFLYFFPSSANPNVWSNLNTWNVSNMINGMGMFSQITLGTLDLRGWTLPKLKYSSYMFYQTSAPIIGDLKDLRPISLEDSNNMFREYKSNELDLSNIRTPNLRSALSMFKFTSAFPNLNITFWITSNLQNMDEMFFGCNEIKPVFTHWDLRSITQCNYVIQSSNYEAIRGISSTAADYNQILIDWESKTNLTCNWGTAGGFRQPIKGLANTPQGLLARTNLINRGWNIVDLNGFN